MTEYEKYLEAQKLAKLMSQPAFPKIKITPERMEELREKYKTELQALETPERKEKDFLAAYGSFEEYSKNHKQSSSLKIVQRIISAPKPPEPKPFNGLLLELSSEQLDKLFELLKSNFIDAEPDRQSFDYIFGSEQKPNQFKPIVWIQSKQLLRELLTGLQKEIKFNIKHPDTRELSNEIERQTSTYFVDKKQKPLQLASNKIVLSLESDYIKNFLATI